MVSAARILSVAMLAALVASAAQAQPVRVLGRSEPVKPAGFQVQWPLSGFEARFTGKSLTVTIEDGGSNWLDVEVDGRSTPLELKQGKLAYTLFSGVAGAHVIKVTRRTGFMHGPTSFTNLKADGLAATVVPDRRILVIGDSISAGYGVGGADQWCRYSPATANAALAHPALTARAFAADIQVIAADGRGLYRNYSGDDPTMATLMWRTLPDAEAKWAGKFDPGIIVVNLGTNDFATDDPGPAFDAAYVSTLKQLGAKWPQARIFAVFGGMLDGEVYRAARTSIETAAGKARSEGVKVEFIEFKPPETGRRFGCDWHPGADAQAYMAQTLQVAIAKSVGWKPVNGQP